MRLGLGLSLSGQGGSYETEAAAYFAAMSVAPDATRKSQLNTLIASLKSAGVYAKLDWLAIHAAHDEQAARVNIIDPTEVASVGVAPTFTTDRGYTGNGTTQYLDSGWNPTVGSHQYAQDSAHMGLWAGTDGTLGLDVGSTNARIGARTTSISLRANSAATSLSSATVTAVGHSMWNRTGATTGDIYRDAASVGSIVTTSAALTNAAFLLLATNNSTTGTVTPANYTDRRVQATHWGSQLTAGETTALYNALAVYMTAVGA